MTTKFYVGKDLNGMWTAVQPFSDTTTSFQLTASTAFDITVPLNMNIVYFSFSKADDVWVSGDGEAFIPGSSTTPFVLLEDGNQVLLEDGFNVLLEGIGPAPLTGAPNLDLNPVARFVKGGQTLSFISSNAAFVNLRFFNLSNKTGEI